MKKTILLSFAILISHNSFLYSQSGWVAQQSNTTVKLNKVFFINSQTGWVVGESGKIIKTTNSGANWTLQVSGTNHTLRSVYFLNDLVGYAIGGNYYSLTISFKLILKTTNGGDSWFTSFYSPDFYKSFSDICFFNTNTGYGLGFGGNESESLGIITETTDGGNTWTESQTHSANIAVQFKGNKHGWIISNYYSDVYPDSLIVLKYDISGSNWSNVFSASQGFVSSSCFMNTTTGWIAGITNVSGFNKDLILKTTDGGINWENFNLTTLSFINSIFFSSNDTGWYCSSGIFKSTNSGANWINQIPSNGSDYYTSINFIDNKTGWVVGSNGKILSTVTGGINSLSLLNENIPDNFTLNQNYPNPFNPKTIINFQLSMINYVKLKVFDALGRQVTTLVDEKLSSGSYEVEFDAGNYPSGIYYYKLEAGSFSEVRKMILVK